MTIAYYLNESELPFRIFPIWNNQRIVSPRPKDRFPDPRIRAKPICNTCKPKAASSVIENPVNPCLAIMSYLLVWHQTHLLYSPSLVAKFSKCVRLNLNSPLSLGPSSKNGFLTHWIHRFVTVDVLNPQLLHRFATPRPHLCLATGLLQIQQPGWRPRHPGTKRRFQPD